MGYPGEITIGEILRRLGLFPCFLEGVLKLLQGRPHYHHVRVAYFVTEYRVYVL